MQYENISQMSHTLRFILRALRRGKQNLRNDLNICQYCTRLQCNKMDPSVRLSRVNDIGCRLMLVTTQDLRSYYA